MKKVYLLRHGESKAQLGEELSFDSELSKNGIKQSKKLKKILPSISFDIIFVSPLKRARQTFEHTGVAREKVHFDSRLAEMLPSESYSSILPYQKNFGYGKPDIHDAWHIDPIDRMADFIDDLYKIKAKTILVVGHAVAMSNMLNIFLQRDSSTGIDKSSFKYSLMNNAALSIFELVEKNDKKKVARRGLFLCDKLLLWNYTEHIRKKGFFGA